MSVKQFVGQELIANEEDSRLYVRLENDDLVDVTKLIDDFSFYEDRDNPALHRIVLSARVTIS